MQANSKFYANCCLDKLRKVRLLRDNKLAIGLAKHNKKFGEHPLSQDFEILKLRDGKVAECLAINSIENGWGRTNAAQDLRVLKLRNGKIIKLLSKFSKDNGWGETEAAKNLQFFDLRDENKNLDKSVSEGVFQKERINNFNLSI